MKKGTSSLKSSLITIICSHFQALVGISSNPKEFEARYAEALNENCHNLAPMLEVLHGIASNETTKKHLAAKAAKAAQQDSGGIQALKDKLLKQVSHRRF